MTDYPVIDKIVADFNARMAEAKTLSQQLQVVYDLPPTQADGLAAMIDAKVAEAREACAEVAEAHAPHVDYDDTECCGSAIASDIRSRGTKTPLEYPHPPDCACGGLGGYVGNEWHGTVQPRTR